MIGDVGNNDGGIACIYVSVARAGGLLAVLEPGKVEEDELKGR